MEERNCPGRENGIYNRLGDGENEYQGYWGIWKSSEWSQYKKWRMGKKCARGVVPDQERRLSLCRSADFLQRTMESHFWVLNWEVRWQNFILYYPLINWINSNSPTFHAGPPLFLLYLNLLPLIILFLFFSTIKRTCRNFGKDWRMFFKSTKITPERSTELVWDQ